MTRQLPSRPNLEQLRKQAKSVLKGHHAATPEILGRIREHHPLWRHSTEAIISSSPFTLADAQLVIAAEYGFETWSRLKAHVLLHEGDPLTEATIESLHTAARRGDLVLLTSLLEKHPSFLNETGGRGVRTALHEAVGGEQVAAVQLLLERGADPNIRCEGDNAFPLHFACEKQHFPIIRLLIEHGADPIGEGDYHELGVIGWATAWSYVDANKEIVDYLLAHGACHNISSAVAMGEFEVIRDLVSRSPADLEKRMDLVNRRRMPLHLAVVKRQPGSLTTLLDLGANTEALDEAGLTALDHAALNGETELARLLLDRGAKVRLPSAIALHRTHDIEKFLRKDPEILKPGHRWEHLIIRASEQAPAAVIEALIEAGADVNTRDDPKASVDSTSGYTALHAAAFSGNLSAVSALLKRGANVQNREDKYRATPAGWANHAGHTAIRDMILRGPVDIMEAVEYGLTERVLAILEQDPSALDRPFRDYPLYPRYAEGWYTPLVFAVTQGQKTAVQFLLDYGAGSTIRSPEGRALHEIALERGHQSIADVLKADGA
jgi:ankyrin repeat protein